MNIYLVRRLDGTIVPAYDEDKDRLKRFKVGEMFLADVTKPRNLRFHRKAFSLFNMVFQNQEIYTDLEHLRHDLTVEAGYYVETSNVHGEVVKRAKSISFAAMDDIEFGEYYNAVIDTIVKYFNFGKDEIIENASQY